MNSREWGISCIILLLALICCTLADDPLCNVSDGRIPVRILHDVMLHKDIDNMVYKMNRIHEVFTKADALVYEFYGVHLVLEEITFLQGSCHEIQDMEFPHDKAIMVGTYEFCVTAWGHTPPPIPIYHWFQFNEKTILAAVQDAFPEEHCDKLEEMLVNVDGYVNNGIVEGDEECDTIPTLVGAQAGCVESKFRSNIILQPLTCPQCGISVVPVRCVNRITGNEIDIRYCTEVIGLPDRADNFECSDFVACTATDLFWGVVAENTPQVYRRMTENDYSACHVRGDDTHAIPIRCAEDLTRTVLPYKCIYQPGLNPAQPQIVVDGSYCVSSLGAVSQELPCQDGDPGFIETPSCYFWACTDAPEKVLETDQHDADVNAIKRMITTNDDRDNSQDPFSFPRCESDDITTGITYEGCDVTEYTRPVVCFKYDQRTDEFIESEAFYCNNANPSPAPTVIHQCTMAIECPEDENNISPDTPAACETCDTTTCNRYEVTHTSVLCVGRYPLFEYVQVYPQGSSACSEFSEDDYPPVEALCYLDDDYRSRCHHDYFCSVQDPEGGAEDGSDGQPSPVYRVCSSTAFLADLMKQDVLCIPDDEEAQCGDGHFSSDAYTIGCFAVSSDDGLQQPRPDDHCAGSQPEAFPCRIPCEADGWRCAIVPTSASEDDTEIDSDQYSAALCVNPTVFTNSYQDCGHRSFTLHVRCFSESGVESDTCDDSKNPLKQHATYDEDNHTYTAEYSVHGACTIQCIDATTLAADGSLPTHLPADADADLVTCDSFDSYVCSNDCGQGQRTKIPVCVNANDDSIVERITQGGDESLCRPPVGLFEGMTWSEDCFESNAQQCIVEYQCQYTYEPFGGVDGATIEDTYSHWSPDNCVHDYPDEDNVCGTVSRQVACYVGVSGNEDEWVSVPIEFCEQHSSMTKPVDIAPSEVYRNCTEYRCISGAHASSKNADASHWDLYTTEQCELPQAAGVEACGPTHFPVESACFFSHISDEEQDVEPLPSRACTSLQKPSNSQVVTNYKGCQHFQFKCKFEHHSGEFTKENCSLDATSCDNFDLCGTHRLEALCLVSKDDVDYIVADPHVCAPAANYKAPEDLVVCTNHYGCNQWQCSPFQAKPLTTSTYPLSQLTAANCKQETSRSVCSETCGSGMAYRHVACIWNGVDVTQDPDREPNTCGRERIRPYNAIACDLSQTSYCSHRRLCDLGDGRYIDCPVSFVSSCPDLCSDSIHDPSDDEDPNTLQQYTWDIPYICRSTQGEPVSLSYCKQSEVLEYEGSRCSSNDDVCCLPPSPFLLLSSASVVTSPSPLSPAMHHLQSIQHATAQCEAPQPVDLNSVNVRNTILSTDDTMYLSWRFFGPSTYILSIYLEHPARPGLLIHLDTARAAFFRQHPIPLTFTIDLTKVTPAVPPTIGDSLAKVHVKLIGRPEFDTVIENIRINERQCESGPLCSAQGGQCVNNVCVCHDGWKGPTCSIEISPCVSYPCMNGLCVMSNGEPTCQCNDGFTGQYCGLHSRCSKTNTSSECQNGSTPRPFDVTNTIETSDGTLVFRGCAKCQCIGKFSGPKCDVCELPCKNGTPNDTCSECQCSPGYYGQFCHCRRVFLHYQFESPPSFLLDAPQASEFSSQQNTGNPDDKLSEDTPLLRQQLKAIWAQHLVNEVSIDLGYPREHITIHKVGYLDEVYSAVLQVELCSPDQQLQPKSLMVVQHSGDDNHSVTAFKEMDTTPDTPLSFRFGNTTHFYHVYEQIRYNINQHLQRRRPNQPQQAESSASSFTGQGTASIFAFLQNTPSSPPDEKDPLVEQRTWYATPSILTGQIASSINGGVAAPVEYIDPDCQRLLPTQPPEPCYGSSSIPELVDEYSPSEPTDILPIVLGVAIPLGCILIIVLCVLWCYCRKVCCFADKSAVDPDDTTKTRQRNLSSPGGPGHGRKKQRRYTAIEMRSSGAASFRSDNSGSGTSMKSGSTTISPQILEDQDLHPSWKKVIGPQGEIMYINDSTMQTSLRRPNNEGCIDDVDIFDPEPIDCD